MLHTRHFFPVGFFQVKRCLFLGSYNLILMESMALDLELWFLWVWFFFCVPLEPSLLLVSVLSARKGKYKSSLLPTTFPAVLLLMVAMERRNFPIHTLWTFLWSYIIFFSKLKFEFPDSGGEACVQGSNYTSLFVTHSPALQIKSWSQD